MDMLGGGGMVGCPRHRAIEIQHAMYVAVGTVAVVFCQGACAKGAQLSPRPESSASAWVIGCVCHSAQCRPTGVDQLVDLCVQVFVCSGPFSGAT